MVPESLARNHVLQTIHQVKLPSYSVWTHDAIEEHGVQENFTWWETVHKTFKNKNLDDEDVLKIINKWKNYYENSLLKPDEYCSKRQGFYLDCDI